MGFFDGYNIATSGMSAQRTRINIVSANIANAQTTHTKDGGPYKKQDVVFQDVLMDKSKKSADSFDENSDNNVSEARLLRGVGVKSIVQDDADPIMRYEPAHPDANEDGYVAYPNINPVIEMVNLIEAQRSYEANIASFNTHKSIDTKTLDIIKG
ncbi:flagellar basal body rod protein FlgC [Arcobacter sp. CECT 8985]|uniref:flagellar basal body rod protein FlgC n=1 Tax=Arcobacter sp. CECT 8985 TaxID=1935424 RepID=UPI00100AF55B|nr:flagellar basal body rod protein FlgC [Arcobacter sp. CECT 8985]RXJ87931.1 flagellar basal body rod protein FlgC [Arcobacter sp. CECT 8985]